MDGGDPAGSPAFACTGDLVSPRFMLLSEDGTQADVVIAFCKIGDRVKVLCERDNMDKTADVLAAFVQHILDRDAKIKEWMKCN